MWNKSLIIVAPECIQRCGPYADDFENGHGTEMLILNFISDVVGMKNVKNAGISRKEAVGRGRSTKYLCK